ncbi:MAG: hypothetical protein KGL57_00045 [Burkholderiales bacterium]|nr:hypothetical protein [Burkholderiales bacterium]
MTLRPLLALVILNGVLSQTAHAYDLDDNVRLEGFGTLGAFKADDPIASVHADPREKTGSLNEVRLDADTVLAAQFTVNPHGDLKGVMQFVSKQDAYGSTWPKIEWAYLGWDVNASLNVKAGRVVAPVFMTSETRNVAFAQVMARPMNTMYQMNPITNANGVNFKWNTRIDDKEFGLEGVAGKSAVTNTTAKYQAKQLFGLAARYTQGPWTLRAGLTEVKIDVALSATTAAKVAALQASPACSNCTAVLNDRLVLTGVKAGVQTIGAMYDDDTYIVQAEWATRPGNSILVPDARGWYAMAGKRIHAWTPYVMLGQFKITEADLGLQPTAPAYASAIQFYNDSFVGLGRGDRKQIGAGVRWDFAPKLALKMQWDQYKVAHPAYGTNPALSYDIPAPPATPSAFDGKVNSLTLNLDFIF